jgi:hypothetical protein
VARYRNIPTIRFKMRYNCTEFGSGTGRDRTELSITFITSLSIFRLADVILVAIKHSSCRGDIRKKLLVKLSGDNLGCARSNHVILGISNICRLTDKLCISVFLFAEFPLDLASYLPKGQFVSV